jgi:hypothetical protein
MKQMREAIGQNLAEQLCWHAARRHDSRIAPRNGRGRAPEDGVNLWWLEQRGITFVVLIKDNTAVTAEARAQAAAGEGITIGRPVHTARHGQGKTTWTERLETEVLGIRGLTTDEEYGTPDYKRHHNRRNFQSHQRRGGPQVE